MIINLTDDTFDSVVSRPATNVIVLWRSDASAFSTVVASQLEDAIKLVKNVPLLAQIDFDKSPNTARRFGVRRVPYIMLFVNGMAMAAEFDPNQFLSAAHMWLHA